MTSKGASRDWRHSPAAVAPECGPDDYLIRLASWIIQDGNYGEFTVGEQRAFALEFWPVAQGFEPIEGTPSLTRIGSEYEVVGSTQWWGNRQAVALHFGLSAYAEKPAALVPPAASQVRGLVQLGVDPFPYLERLSGMPGAPPLIYDWHVSGLYLQTGPWIEEAPRFFTRDESATGWHAVPATNSWTDDDGRALYLLRARPLGEPRLRL